MTSLRMTNGASAALPPVEPSRAVEACHGQLTAHATRPLPAAADLYRAGEVRVLILDDDESVCRVIQAALVPNDFVVDVASEPSRMQELLLGARYHVVILDYVIPGVEAGRVLEWVHDYQADASVIVVAAYPPVDSALNCLRARTYEYLTKPFQIAHLQRVVLRCLEAKGLLRLSESALRESLGAAIRERRKGLGLTLAQMAQRTGVSLGYLSQIELGKNSASIETLYRISLGLGIKMSELFETVQPPG